MSFQIWFMFTFCREIKWCFFFEVNQVLNLYNTINYVNFFYCFFCFVGSNITHDSNLPFIYSIQPKIPEFRLQKRPITSNYNS